jgi:hypothetical protein
MRPAEWLRVILFWALMVFLATVLLKMKVFGSETELRRIFNFLPLVLVAALFLFVWTGDRAIKRKGLIEQERQGK